jgi:hypothetical protein
MKLQNSIFTGARVATVCGLALSAGFLTTRAKADDWDKKTILTVSEPVQIYDTYLQPGTYVLMLDRYSQSNRHIVRIFNDDQSHLINTVMAFPAYRVNRTGKTQFTFWETPPGMAHALRDWYWPGDNFGQEFAYPAHLKQVAMVVPKSTTTGEAAGQVAAVDNQKSQVGESSQINEPAPVQVEERKEDVLLAQNNQATAPEAQQNAAADNSQQNAADNNQRAANDQQANNAQANNDQAIADNAPAANNNDQLASNSNNAGAQELPKTATAFPLVGLAGLLSLGVYGVLRVRHSS